jgi:putative flavoprotein involved in K+ transport
MENSISNVTHVDVIIIGAGPAGLCAGFHLQKQNINYLILEQNEQVGSTWLQMPEHLHLISYWKSNYLIKEDLKLFHPHHPHSARDFAKYLQGFASRFSLNINTNVKVNILNKTADGFSVETTKGTFKSKFIVDCRGYFNHPFVPLFEQSGEQPLLLHFKDYKNRMQMKNYKKILIVGKRLSAGQLLIELANDDHELFLSVRSHIHFSPPLFVLRHFLRHLNIYEAIAKSFKSKIKREVEVPMHHNAKKIIDEKVKIVGNITRIENKKIYFDDGSAESIDAVIFATGFHPPKIELKNDFESKSTDGLFYLGRGSQRTFTSRFLRGIREDAIILANLIRGNLASNNKSQ